MLDPVILYRVYHRLWRRSVPLVPAIMHRLNRKLTGCDLPPSIRIGCGTEFAHWGPGVAVSPHSMIGADCRLYPGARVLVDASVHPPPHIAIGDRVQIGVGAVVLASHDLVVGNDAQIGAGALVRDSVAAGETVVRCDDIHLRDRYRQPEQRRRPLVNPVRIHAISRWAYLRKLPLLPGLFYRLNYLLNRCVLAPTSQIAPTARVDRWVALSFANVWPGAILRHGVLIARNVRHRKAIQKSHIEIKSGAEIGAGAIIIGADGLQIGAGSRVADGAVVHKSVPPGCTVAGVPARIMSRPKDESPQ